MGKLRERGQIRPRGGFISAALFSSFTLLASCYPAHLPTYQRERVCRLDETSLSIGREMTESSFIKKLKESHGTNIVSSGGFFADKRDSAVTADFMGYVYFFRGGKYLTRFKTECDQGKLPLRPYLKVVYGKTGFGVLLIAENITHEGKRVMQALMEENGAKTTATYRVDELIKRHNGMVDPYVMGSSIEEGITMCARDRKGNPWDVVYIIRKKGDSLELEQKDRRKAEGCSCFREWLEGKGGREASGIKID